MNRYIPQAAGDTAAPTPPERAVFMAAMYIEATEERAGFLDAACGPDAELRGRVDALLDSHRRAGGDFLAKPAVDPLPPGCGTRPLRRTRAFFTRGG